MDIMQLNTIGLLFIRKVVAVQAHSPVHLFCLSTSFLVTGIFTTCSVGNKLSVVNCYESTFDYFIGHLMTILAAGLHKGAFTFTALEEMACKTYIIVHVEVLISFKAAVTCAARDLYPVNYFFDVIPVSEPDSTMVDIP
jgi:hypothetical protein